MDMSFREKSSWLCLLSTLGIYTWYFISAFRLHAGGDARSMDFVLLFAGAGVAQIVVLIVVHSFIAARSDSDSNAVDERDVTIELKSLRYSHIVLSVGVFLSVLGIVACEVNGDAGGPALSVSPFVLGHGLLLSFVIAEVLYYGTQLFYYRRGV